MPWGTVLSCIMLSLGLLLSLLSLLRLCFARPLARDGPYFLLTNISYYSDEIYSTPAHLATYGGNITFDLANTAAPYTAHCTARGVQLSDFFYGDIVYECEKSAEPSAAANFIFARADNHFVINQTWYDAE